MTPEFRPGTRGQFQVKVDGRVVLERKGGLIALITRRPWPTEDAVIHAIESVWVPGE